jgi:hypothetical protein
MTKEVTTISLSLVVSWLFSVLFLLVAVTNYMRPIEAMLFGFIAVMLMPPINKELAEKHGIKLSGGLKFVIVIAILFLAGMVGQQEGAVVRSGGSSQTTNTDAVGTTPQLELDGNTGERGYGYITISGQVKNISGSPMKDVEAVATFVDKAGNFVTSDDALIDYNPILAGQTSPFKVMQTENPAITSWKVSFKSLFGSEIPYLKNTSKN